MTLFNNLSTLESAGLIQMAKVEPDLEYLFRHSLVQDAAYASILETDRKRLHLAVGNAIESLYPDRKRELAAILAHHFKEGSDDERAMEYFIIAGDEALKVYANQEAEYQYRRALELICCPGSHIAWIHSGLGEALYRQGRLDESLEAIRKGIEIYKSIGDMDGTARLYARQARVTWYTYDHPAGLRIGLEGLELVKDAAGSVGKASLMHEVARAYYFNQMSDKALILCREALALAEQLGAVNVEADTLATLGLLPGLTPTESLEALRKAAELSESHGLLQIAMRSYQNLGTMTRTWLADNQAALKYFRKSAELARMRGVASEEVLGEISYTACQFSEGKLKEVEASLPYLEELARRNFNPEPTLLSIKSIKASLTALQGDLDAGIAGTRECLVRWRELENLEGLMGGLDQLSYLLLEKQRWGYTTDLEEVDALLHEANQIIENDNSNQCIWLYSRIGVLRARQGRLREARMWLEKASTDMQARPSAWDERFKLDCQVEIFMAEQDWLPALSAVEKLAGLEKTQGYFLNYTKDLLSWADILLRTGEPADLERAQSIITEAFQMTSEMNTESYRKIAEDMLKVTRTKLHAQAVDHENLTRELKKARQVQESLLPENPPKLKGWGLEVLLKPAHETSGDFYDFLTLPGDNVGLVIADVTDKGTGAALYMALSRSLWRTFAVNHPTEPQQTLAETNQRIMADTHGGLFITVFYGILDPKSGALIYGNAGHLPALLVRAVDGSVERLERTGMPLGVFSDAAWTFASVQVEPGDSLVLYTDGITDAINSDDQFYGLERLEGAVKKHRGKSARKLRDALYQEVNDWSKGSAQFDDLTLVVVVRE